MSISTSPSWHWKLGSKRGGEFQGLVRIVIEMPTSVFTDTEELELRAGRALSGKLTPSLDNRGKADS
jgi:hypothetical protein